MSVEYYLIRDDNKTYFELGKQGFPYYWLENLFDATEFEPVPQISCWKPLKHFKLKDLELLKLSVDAQWPEEPYDELRKYWYTVMDEIHNWSKDQFVYIGNEDIKCDLKYEAGYTQTGTRYTS